MYRLTDDQTAVVARAAEVADVAIAPHAAAVDAEARFPREALDGLGRAGLLGLTIPVEFGGMGQGLRTSAAALETIAQRDASAAMVYLMHLCGVACYLANPALASDQLRAAARGEHLSTLAWSERGSRSHFWAPMSRAQHADGGIRIDADKSWVTSAGIADGYAVSTGAAGGEGLLDTTIYYVGKGAAGMSVAGAWDSLGMRGNMSSPMKLDGVMVAAEQALSEPHKGFEFMLGVVLPWFQIGNAAISIGIAEAAVAATVGHITAKRFEDADARLADLPTLRAKVAQMRIQTDAARAHLVATLDAAESAAPTATLMVLETKALAGDTAKSVTDTAMQVCGGAAFSKQLGVERQFRDARAASVMAPTSDVLHEFIGRALCGMELF